MKALTICLLLLAGSAQAQKYEIDGLKPGYYLVAFSFIDLTLKEYNGKAVLIPATKNINGQVRMTNTRVAHRIFHINGWNGKKDGSYNWAEIKSHPVYGQIYWDGNRWLWEQNELYESHLRGRQICCIDYCVEKNIFGGTVVNDKLFIVSK